MGLWVWVFVVVLFGCCENVGEFVKLLVGEGGILILLQFCLVAGKMWERERKCEEWLFDR